MRSLSAVLRPMAALATIGCLPALAGSAQTFAARVGGPAPAMIVADSSAGRLTVPGHHRGSAEKLIYARVRDGVYTVDGMVAKIRLNYDVQGANFMYLFVPGVGTAVVSVTPSADAVATQANLRENELSFGADGHQFKLTGIAVVSDKGQPPAHLYVRLDRSAWHLSRQPMVGFGDRAAIPYEWPGALPPEHAEEATAIPPMPASVLPRTIAATTASAQSPTAVSPSALHPVSLR